jgi:hypothetical protein
MAEISRKRDMVGLSSVIVLQVAKPNKKHSRHWNFCPAIDDHLQSVHESSVVCAQSQYFVGE